MKRLAGWLRNLDDRLEHWIFDAAPGKALAALVAGGLALAMWSGGPAVAPRDAETQAPIKKYLADRPWLDDIPLNPTPDNPCHAYFFMDDGRQGVYVTFLSRYRQEMELFYYKLRGDDKIEIYLPDSKKKAVGGIKISETKHGQFDLKMHLDNCPKAGGAADYYSFQQWDTQGALASARAAAERFAAEASQD